MSFRVSGYSRQSKAYVLNFAERDAGATPFDHESAPNHEIWIDPLTALGANRVGERDRSLLAEGTDIGIKEELDLPTQTRPAP